MNTTDPIGMSFVVLDYVFAFSKGIAKLDSSITTSRNNLTVVNGKSNGKHIFGVAYEVTSRGSDG